MAVPIILTWRGFFCRNFKKLDSNYHFHGCLYTCGFWYVKRGTKTRRYWIWFVLIWFIASKLWFIVIKSRSDDSGIDSFGIDLTTVFWIWFIDIKWKTRWFWNWFVLNWFINFKSKTRWFWVWFDWNWTLNDWFVWIWYIDHKTTFGRRWP